MTPMWFSSMLAHTTQDIMLAYYRSARSHMQRQKVNPDQPTQTADLCSDDPLPTFLLTLEAARWHRSMPCRRRRCEQNCRQISSKCHGSRYYQFDSGRLSLCTGAWHLQQARPHLAPGRLLDVIMLPIASEPRSTQLSAATARPHSPLQPNQTPRRQLNPAAAAPAASPGRTAALQGRRAAPSAGRCCRRAAPPAPRATAPAAPGSAVCSAPQIKGTCRANKALTPG